SRAYACGSCTSCACRDASAQMAVSTAVRALAQSNDCAYAGELAGPNHSEIRMTMRRARIGGYRQIHICSRYTQTTSTALRPHAAPMSRWIHLHPADDRDSSPTTTLLR